MYRTDGDSYVLMQLQEFRHAHPNPNWNSLCWGLRNCQSCYVIKETVYVEEEKEK